MVPLAQEFIQGYISDAQESAIQSVLLSYFYGKDGAKTVKIQAQAGLCLRCYLSDAILKACQTIAHLFGGSQAFTYRDLLPFVLADDGKTQIVLDPERKTQFLLQADETLQRSTYPIFSVEVLRTYKFESQTKLSLSNWAFLQTKQNSEIKQFLAEFGFQHLSDWALLNRARPYQLEQLSEPYRQIVETFHGVYRRDRRLQQAGSKRCQDPSSQQLQEMIANLQKKKIPVSTEIALIQTLKSIASQLRQYDIWSNRVPLEIPDEDSGRDTLRSDLPISKVDESDLEQQELLLFFHQQLNLALNDAITQELRHRITTLEKSRNYAPLASQLIPGLQLYYNQALSLKEIAPILGMSSGDQTRRILNPGELLSKVRALTVQHVLEQMLQYAQEKGFAQTPPDPTYLRTLAEQVEAIADQEIFQEAVEEMRAGQGRSLNSVYAQQLRIQLNTITQGKSIHG